MIEAELMCMNAAHALGLCEPYEYVSQEQQGDKTSEVSALRIPRFDVSAQGGRYHRLSFETLLAHPERQVGYAGLARLMDACSATPDADKEKLFVHALLNVFVGNTDDHLRNFSMRYQQGLGWQLSPSYDITPADQEWPSSSGDINARHDLFLLGCQDRP